ncbi:MAG: UDP-N-acetylmuramoyl-tripeptide--D-alanyl-D-alanine ligase [Candidatus Omnitrophota bacterium]
MFKISELLKATSGKLISANCNAEIRGISIDSRTIKPKEAFLAIKGNNFDGHNFIDEALKRGASLLITKPQGRKATCLSGRRAKPQAKIPVITVDDTVKALGDIARFYRQRLDTPVIAVTGSNGKTTTKEMIAWVLQAKFGVLKNEGTKNNNIGLPMALLNPNKDHDIAVLEIGTNHPGEVANLASICQPNIGVITNIGPAHLEYFKSLKNVFAEKYSLIGHLKGPRIAVLNADDPFLKKKICQKTKRAVIFGFGVKEKSDFSATQAKFLSRQLRFRVNKAGGFRLKSPGRFYIYNCLIAVAIGRIFGMGYDEIAKRLASFKFPSGRLNFFAAGRINFIDDTYNSNPLSLGKALETLRCLKSAGNKIFVMGDMMELGEGKEDFHRQAAKEIASSCDKFIAVGSLSRLAAEESLRLGFDAANIFTCETIKEAKDILFNKLCPGRADIVLVKGSRAMKMEEVFNKP